MIESMTNAFYTSLQGTPLIALLVAFATGILFTVSPCTFTMAPVVMGYVGGYAGNSANSRVKGFVYSSIFVLGNGLVLAVLGATVSYVGEFAGQQSFLWYYFLVGVLILMGMHLLGVYKINFPAVINYQPKVRGMLGAFLLGGIMGLATSPCATPILTAVLAYVAMGGGAGYGALLLFSYAMGKGVILILIGTFTGIIKYDEKVADWSNTMEKISGIVLIAAALIFWWRI